MKHRAHYMCVRSCFQVLVCVPECKLHTVAYCVCEHVFSLKTCSVEQASCSVIISYTVPLSPQSRVGNYSEHGSGRRTGAEVRRQGESGRGEKKRRGTTQRHHMGEVNSVFCHRVTGPLLHLCVSVQSV